MRVWAHVSIFIVTEKRFYKCFNKMMDPLVRYLVAVHDCKSDQLALAGTQYCLWSISRLGYAHVICEFTPHIEYQMDLIRTHKKVAYNVNTVFIVCCCVHCCSCVQYSGKLSQHLRISGCQWKLSLPIFMFHMPKPVFNSISEISVSPWFVKVFSLESFQLYSKSIVLLYLYCSYSDVLCLQCSIGQHLIAAVCHAHKFMMVS